MRFFLWQRRRRQLDEEILGHLEMAERDRLDRGESPQQAQHGARREFGNVALVEHITRDQWGWRWIEDLLQDLRYAGRTLRKNLGFASVAVLTLALGIGANTAIFSVIDAVVLRPLPFAAPDRLVWLNGKFPQSEEAAVCTPDFLDYRAGNRSFESLAAMGYRASPSNLSSDKPEQVLTTIVTAGFFDMLGVHMLLGRDFLPADERVNTPQAVILGNGIWKRAFGGDAKIVGRNIRLDGQSFLVAGVLPEDLPILSESQIWQPAPLLAPGMNVRLAHFLKVIGRLKPGVDLRQSQSDLDAIAARLSHEYPNTNEGWTLRQRPLTEVLIGPVRPALLLICGAVGLLLLIACGNVANLLLARSIVRDREFAVRAALGASRGRMIRQALTESVVLALLGGALGVLGAIWGVQALRAVGPANLPRLDEIHINGAVLLFTSGISLFTGILFGLIPALQVFRRDSSKALKESGRGSAPRGHRRLSSALVISEIAIAVTLLVGAGLLLKSFWRLVHVNPGFQTTHVISAGLSLNAPGYGKPEQRARFWQRLEQEAANLPGVEAAGGTSELPLGGEHSDSPFYLEGRTYAPSEYDDANFREVTPGYLSAMGIPLLAGRWFSERDNETADGVLVVNQEFAKRFFNAENPLGKRVRIPGDRPKPREIIGLVGNVSHDTLGENQQPEMYVPYAQFSPMTMRLVVRGVGDPENLSVALRDIVAGIDKDETLSAVRSMDEVLYASVAQPRFSSQLLGLFAALALLLAAVGLYGLMAYSVSQRTGEIGIRMALGATHRDILHLVLRHGSILAFTGIALGLVGSVAASRLLSGLLFGVSPTDPVTFAGVAGLLVAIALLACYLPARRAMRVDPMVALRYE